MKIGILGGGQLARMLCLKGHELGDEIHILSEKKDDPAAQVTQNWHQGSYHNKAQLRKFINQVDLITFESEFVDCHLLKKIASDKTFHPSLDNLLQFQDRWTQKNLFLKYKLPTASFRKIDSQEDLKSFAPLFNYKYVLKKRYGGYDGYGTFICRNRKEHTKWIAFFSKVNLPLNLIIEEFIPFEKELAVQFFRNERNEFTQLPLVESKQIDSKCDWIKGPIDHNAFPEILKKVKKLMQAENYVGTLAFEFFSSQGRLLINESAPRVHNSGHYSLNHPAGDQFSLHLKAITQRKLQLSATELLKYSFVMTNLIGKSTRQIVFPDNLLGHLHWYGKTGNRKGRKMGHINWITSFSPENSDKLLKLALKERKKIKL
ncbi:MAG: ATP-grasp domain-containing protein [Bdellovibrionaceae bacterium]|nr:ATP-grasp domain-containing protein [Pseudobdellovibrionaceae bacterium]NUM58322.1 ATP-grasp domain-containing protein [Pseudobdellovibrionaceae bacterium]